MTSLLRQTGLMKTTGLQKQAELLTRTGLKQGGAAPSGVPVNVSLPLIFGTAQSGQTLTASHGSWTNSPTSYSYQWQADAVDIGGATNSTFLLTNTQIGAVITVVVTAHNSFGDSSPETSAATSAVLPAAPVNTVLPVISGTTQSGQTLSTTNGTWSNTPTSYAYQWYDDGVAIGGATASTFLLTDTQLGGMITVTVTATNAGGSTPATSASVGPVTSGGGGGATGQPIGLLLALTHAS